MDGTQLIGQIIDFILGNSFNENKIDAIESKTLDLCV